ncbi:MAG: class I SAM-dependent rRNA methyltransferase, partial [Anaerolineae bacterium]
MSSTSTLPRVTVSSRGGSRLKGGHLWVYRSDVDSTEAVPPGSIVKLVDTKGRPLGTAVYSSSSQIAIRLISPEPVSDLAAYLKGRIRQAVAYRELVVSNTDAYRVVFSEADFLPGLIVDRYNDILSFQILIHAMDTNVARQTVISTLKEKFTPAGIVERVDPRVRELEQLAPRSSALVEGEKTSTTFTMNGVRFQFSALSGQKTGAFLDQRENYASAEQ